MPGIGQSLDASGQFSNAELTARLKEQAEGFTTFVEQIQGRKLRAA
jgi:hypothetical protein